MKTRSAAAAAAELVEVAVAEVVVATRVGLKALIIGWGGASLTEIRVKRLNNYAKPTVCG